MGEFKVLLIAGNESANDEFIRVAAARFGGATVGPICKGYWKNPEGKIVRDDVLPVYVATDDTSGVIRLANEYRLDVREDCVYVRHPNGSVSLVGLN